MHSLSISLAIALLLMLELGSGALSQLSLVSQSLVLAISVVVIGLPHGGLDLQFGRSLLTRWGARRPTISFLSAYLTTAVVVIAGWIVSPVCTVLAFFALAAWHFGLEEEAATPQVWWKHLTAATRGGMVIWVPALFRPAEIGELLNLILPSGSVTAAADIVGSIVWLAPVFLVLLCLDLVVGGGDPLDGIWNIRLRLATFFSMFVTFPVLLSFCFYFCGWHSWRGLLRLRTEVGSSRALIKALLPISLAAALLFAVSGMLLTQIGRFDSALLQTTFIGLSAVAIPHLLLHVCLTLTPVPRAVRVATPASPWGAEA